ncbi:MAG: AMP-binding protein, partial [Proteobacteria bacterium]|nr:AMP-binding protein [Pseudomonadota bacterium]
MNVANFLDASARRLPHSPAIALGTRTVLTYGELALRVARLSAGLRFRLGLKAGDRVALFMQNCVEYFEVLFAIWHAGLVAVPVNAKLHPRE